MSNYSLFIDNIKERLKNALKVYKPNKINLIIASSIFVVTTLLLGGFPLDAVNVVEGFCPSFGPNSQPADCVDPYTKLNNFGLILNLGIIYATTSLFTELFRRRSKWL